MSGGVIDVGRPRSKPEPKDDGWEAKKLIFQMRGSEKFKDWLRKLADFDATDTTEVVERALASYARTIGFPEPRPKR